MNKKVLVS
ncbi:UNVERIFIED_CONTAM: hypothetical protein GTU68_044219 [Idotea baltica]|nr:hypothetical protein [Idotea baltica]